jgi:predicted AAA+ superfamily ATPase
LYFCKKEPFIGLYFCNFDYLCRKIVAVAYIKRHIDKYLEEWKTSSIRKPLLLRGARQVGKSSSVREFGKSFDYFLEINFERKNSDVAKGVFERSSNPKQICSELSVIYGTPIVAGKTLLFIDEIQSCIAAISALRFFYEDYPELHIIAAGSLLEFALENVPSFGVGRIRSMFMYPLSFDEYLRAMGHDALAGALCQATPENPLSEPLHKTCLKHLIPFVTIGGMPKVIATYAENGSLLDCQQVIDDVLITYQDDFSKYKEKVPALRLREVFASVAKQIGYKFVYSHASQNANHLQIKEAVELLTMAGLVYPVIHTAANGIPLGAEINIKHQKLLLFDTGILQRFLRLDLGAILLGETLEQINKGSIAELFVGLEQLKSAPATNPAQLYFWRREARNSQAEVDYVVQSGTEIVPIEVKSGTKGAMQSMHIFMGEKKLQRGVRCSLENFGKLPNIDIYPLYAAGQIK